MNRLDLGVLGKKAKEKKMLIISYHTTYPNHVLYHVREHTLTHDLPLLSKSKMSSSLWAKRTSMSQREWINCVARKMAEGRNSEPAVSGSFPTAFPEGVQMKPHWFNGIWLTFVFWFSESQISSFLEVRSFGFLNVIPAKFIIFLLVFIFLSVHVYTTQWLRSWWGAGMRMWHFFIHFPNPFPFPFLPFSIS